MIFLLGKRRARNQLPLTNNLQFAAKITKNDLQNTQESSSNGLVSPNDEYNHLFYHDPFYNFKPPRPYDVNLLAPNKFRFAPTLIQNHKFVPEKQIFPPNKAKPVSVTLDIYPMKPELDDEKMTTPRPSRQAVRQTMLHNLNSLYHISNAQRPQLPAQEPQKIFDVTGFQKIDPNSPEMSDLEKMILHLNLHPRKNHGNQRLDSDHSASQLYPRSNSTNGLTTSEKPGGNKFLESPDSGKMDYKALIEDVSENPLFKVPQHIQDHILSKILQDGVTSNNILANIYQNQNFTPRSTTVAPKKKYHTLPLDVLNLPPDIPYEAPEQNYPSLADDSYANYPDLDQQPTSEFPQIVHIPQTNLKNNHQYTQTYPPNFSTSEESVFISQTTTKNPGYIPQTSPKSSHQYTQNFAPDFSTSEQKIYIPQTTPKNPGHILQTTPNNHQFTQNYGPDFSTSEHTIYIPQTTPKNYQTTINSPISSEYPQTAFIPQTTPKHFQTSPYSIPQYQQNVPIFNQFPPPDSGFESGFYPINFNNKTFQSQPLDKNFMADLAPQNVNISGSNVLMKRKDELDYTDLENSSDFKGYEDQVMAESKDEAVWTEHTLETNPNLVNHKPYFTEVNDTLINS